MSGISWSLAKSEELKRRHRVSFDELILSKLVAVLEHPGRSHQNIMLFEFRAYIWVVPYVSRGDDIFLKTLFPSRKYTRKWKKGELE